MALKYYNGGNGWNITYTVLIGVVLLAVLPFTFLSMVKNKYGHDPSRRFVPWLKASFCLFCLTLCLSFTQAVIAIYSVHNGSANRDTIRAAFHIGYLAELFLTLSAAATMVFLLELGLGMHYALDRVSGTFEKAVRYSALALAAIVAAVAIAFYGVSIDFQLNFTNRVGVMNPQDQRAYERAKAINEMIATTSIIVWVASLVITGLSMYIYIRRKASPLKRASDLYLAASLLNLVGSTWNFAYAVHWLLNIRNAQRDYVMVLLIVLAWWTRGVLLIAGFFLAVRSGPNGGVWAGTRKGGSIDGAGGSDYYHSSSRFGV